MTRSMKGITILAAITAVVTAVLLLSGALVTTTNTGDTIPEWPATEFQENSIFEYSHRATAGITGILVLALALWLFFRKDVTRRSKVLAALALIAVIVQAVMGGFRVLFLVLPPEDMAVIHGSFGQVIFCALVAIALFATTGWKAPVQDRSLGTGYAKFVWVTAILLVCQLVLGAWLRHKDERALDHIIGAVIVSACLLTVAIRGLLHHRPDWKLAGPSAFILCILLVQVSLGIVSYAIRLSDFRRSLEAPAVYIGTISAHVLFGALLMASTVVLALRASKASGLIEPQVAGVSSGNNVNYVAASEGGTA